MSQSADNELLDAFLVEAGELVEKLDEQLIELERAPQDADLLNAVFRAFHTVKGGAGFLGANRLVDLCHHAEDLLNEARNRRLDLTADHVDALLEALDRVNGMMQGMADGDTLEPAPADLMARLKPSAAPAAQPTRSAPPPTTGTTAAAKAPPAAERKPVAAHVHEDLEGASDPVNDAFVSMLDTACERHDGRGTVDAESIDDSEFEALLDQLHGEGGAPGQQTDAAASAADGPIGDSEFEALLDELHGDGGAPGQAAATRDDRIDDSEFENLLDELHGAGKAPGAPAATTPSDRIDDSEFEALLDKLYGPGGAPGARADGNAVQVPGTTQAASGPLPEAPAAAPAPAAEKASTPAPASAAEKPRTRPARRGSESSHAETTVRVDTARMDALVNAAGELILVRNRLLNLASRNSEPGMERAIAELDRVADNMQNAALMMRMQPIGRLFQRFPRIVRDLARQLGKSVELQEEGAETNLDRTLVESLADPLIHLLRNAVDHGLEDTEARRAAGKPETGQVHLSAGQEGERIVIRIRDDGRGMDPEVLREKAVQKGVIDADRAAQLQPAECFDLIFAPGFSTREEISDISGRGVGMDVVKTKVAELGGTIAIESEVGVGTTVRISIPLTLAILRVLMVRVGPRLMALPLSSVKEVFELTRAQVRELDGSVVAAHRGRPLPLTDLARWAGLDSDPSTKEAHHVVLLHVGHRHVGCVVHEVLGREDVMIKPLGGLLHRVSGIAGATITGDGRIALVLDLNVMAERAAQHALARCAD